MQHAAGRPYPLIGTSVRVTAAQIDLIGVRWLKIGEDPSSAPNGGSARVTQAER
jgi:hypothetical protein